MGRYGQPPNLLPEEIPLVGLMDGPVPSAPLIYSQLNLAPLINQQGCSLINANIFSVGDAFV